jgi:hypothetical protein
VLLCRYLHHTRNRCVVTNPQQYVAVTERGTEDTSGRVIRHRRFRATADTCDGSNDSVSSHVIIPSFRGDAVSFLSPSSSTGPGSDRSETLAFRRQQATSVIVWQRQNTSGAHGRHRSHAILKVAHASRAAFRRTCAETSPRQHGTAGMSSVAKLDAVPCSRLLQLCDLRLNRTFTPAGFHLRPSRSQHCSQRPGATCKHSHLDISHHRQEHKASGLAYRRS